MMTYPVCPSWIGRGLDQICFVVEDLDEAIEYWTRVNGIETRGRAYDLAKGQKEKEYWGEPGDFECSCAYGAVGDLVVELARHEHGREHLSDWLDERGVGPHHIGFRVADADEYRAGLRRVPVSGRDLTRWEG